MAMKNNGWWWGILLLLVIVWIFWSLNGTPARESTSSIQTRQKIECSTQARESAVMAYADYCTKSKYCEYVPGTYLIDNYEHLYQVCLREHGL